MTDRLEVLHMTSWYPTAERPVGGIFVREHVKAVAAFHDVSVVHLRGLDPSLGRIPWNISEVTDHTLTEGFPTLQSRHGSPSSRLRRFTYLAAALAAFRRVRASGFRPDVIHAHEFQAGHPACVLGSMFKVPVVVTEHSSAFPRQLLSPSELRLARMVFRRARFVCPVSDYLRRAIEGCGIDARFRIVPNAVDANVFHPGGSQRRRSADLLFVGLMPDSHIKDVPSLLWAVSALPQTDWRLDLVGDGPARHGYEALAKELSIDDRVTFHGIMTRSAIAEMMREADVFVLPSLSENLPCVLIEAQASGLPIVASDVGGIPEIVGPIEGKLVPPADPESLASAISEVISHLDRYQPAALAERARNRFDLLSIGRQLDAIYREALA
jgi:glycosyltransferase involved in cell wall biosynthesis